jgi:hypothetical protein
MATAAQTPQPRTSRNAERLFFQFWTAAAFAMIIMGFLPTWFGRAMFASPQMLPLTPLVWLHGIVFSLWLALFVTQVTLIGTGNRKLHMQLGKAALLFLVVLPVLSFVSALHGAARHAGPPPIPADVFLAVPLAAVIVLPVLIWLGWANRFNAHVHKRMMAFATCVMIQPASGRFFPSIHGMLTVPLAFLFAIVLFDMAVSRRIDGKVLGGAILVFAGLVLPTAIGGTAAWLNIAHGLMRWWG